MDSRWYAVFYRPRKSLPSVRRRIGTAWLSPLLARMRRSPQYLAVLEPFLGKDIKQISHQNHWARNIPRTCEMEAGDLLLWTLFTVHGSAPNVSDYERRFMINTYVRASDSERGE